MTGDGRIGGPGGAAPARVRCVGAIIFDGAGRLLLVQRGHAPDRGRWSIPGGRVEPGESDAQAVAREVAEETALTVQVGDLAGMVERPGLGGSVYEIYDYDCVVVGRTAAGEGAPARAAMDTGTDPVTGAVAGATAGDDAADLRWVAPTDLGALPLTGGLVEALRGWHRLG